MYGFGKKRRERLEKLKQYHKNYQPVGIPVTGKPILAGELSLDGSIAQASTEEAYKRWLEHYNFPLPPSELYERRYSLFVRNVEKRMLKVGGTETRKEVPFGCDMDWDPEGNHFGVALPLMLTKGQASSA